MTLPDDFREQLPELLDERAAQRAPGELFDRFAERMEDAPQRPGWATSERWFPMHAGTDAGHTRRTVAIFAAMLLLVLALGAAFAVGSRLLATEQTIIVAADGTGDVTTLHEGVAMAVDGDTILVRPGTYTEFVSVDMDVMIRGDGDPGSVVVRAPEAGPSVDNGLLAGSDDDQRYAILVNDAAPMISGLTFSAEPSAIVVNGGAPTIEGNRFEGVGVPRGNDPEVGRSAIVVNSGSRGIIRDNQFVGSGPIASFDLSHPRIEGNELVGGGSILGGFGDEAVISGNRVEDATWGIESRGDAAPLITDNIVDSVGYPIRASQGAARIIGNTVEHDASPDTGIQYDDGAGAIEGNTVLGYARAVVTTDFDGPISGNVIDSGFEGVNVTDTTGTISHNRIKAVFTGIKLSGSSPDVVDNRIEGGVNSVSIEGTDSAPTFLGNELCETNTPVAVSDGATQPDPSGFVDCAEA